MTDFANLPIFSLAFRPMFLAAAMSALVMPTLWISFLTGNTFYPGDLFTMVDWHAFEMYAGFGNALFAGFLLTASVNWSGQKPRGGWPLALLLLFWLIERIMVLVPGLNAGIHYIYHVPFAFLFIALLSVQLKGNTKNLRIFIPWLIFFTLAKFVFLTGAIYQASILITIGKALNSGLIKVAIVIVTGRIIPFFIFKRIDSRPTVPPLVELVSIITIILVLLPDLIQLPAPISFLIYSAAFLVHSIRFVYWKPWRTIKVPILFILQLGYLWLLAYLASAAINFIEPGTASVSLHIFTAGAIGTFAIAMMTRVSLGHTGRKVQSDVWIIVMYVCIIAGALVRTIVPVVFPEVYLKSLHYASGFWTLGFLIYLIRFTPILTKKRM